MKLEVLNLHRGGGVKKEMKEKRKELRKVMRAAVLRIEKKRKKKIDMKRYKLIPI